MHRHINKQDRACIAQLLRKHYSYSAIARVLDLSPSTISREVRRNTKDVYDVRAAGRQARARRKVAKANYRLIETHPDLEKAVAKQYLRRAGRRRRRYGTRRTPSRYQANKRSIHTRPAITTIGNWEGDTILGSERKLRIVTYVDKLSGYLVAAKLAGTADKVHMHAKQSFKNLPCQSITYDNGTEFALHKLIERDTKATVYFADPGKPHQRGTNENTNGLLRQYFPKGSAFASIKNSDVSRAVTQLNNRPRKRLNYLTPQEFLEKKGVRFR